MICMLSGYWSLVFQPRPLPLLSFCSFFLNSRVVNDDTLITQWMLAVSVFPLCWKQWLKFESKPSSPCRVWKSYSDNLMQNHIIQSHLESDIPLNSPVMCAVVSTSRLQSSITTPTFNSWTSVCKPFVLITWVIPQNPLDWIKLWLISCCSVNNNPLFGQ